MAKKDAAVEAMDNDSIVMLDMNLEDYADFEPLPEGSYPAEIVEAKLAISDKGNEYFAIALSIHPDDYPVDYDPANAPEGTKMYYNRIQKPTADNRRSITALKNLYRAMNFKMKTNTINPGEWEGKRVLALVKMGEYNGERRPEIRSIESLEG
jgi:hypothetical protein